MSSSNTLTWAARTSAESYKKELHKRGNGQIGLEQKI